MRYFVKPVIVDAIQWSGSNVQEVVDFVAGNMPPGNGLKSVRFEYAGDAPTTVTVSTQDGAAILTASGDDWVVCGADGRISAVKPDVFAATYDLESAHALGKP